MSRTSSKLKLCILIVLFILTAGLIMSPRKAFCSDTTTWDSENASNPELKTQVTSDVSSSFTVIIPKKITLAADILNHHFGL